MTGKKDVVAAIENPGRQVEALEKKGDVVTVRLSDADMTAIRDMVRPPPPVVDPDFKNRFEFIRGSVIPGSRVRY